MTNDNFCFYLQNRLIQTSQTGGQRYSDTSPFSIPYIHSTLIVADKAGAFPSGAVYDTPSYVYSSTCDKDSFYILDTTSE
jgi:hypothetical protein